MARRRGLRQDLLALAEFRLRPAEDEGDGGPETSGPYSNWGGSWADWRQAGHGGGPGCPGAGPRGLKFRRRTHSQAEADDDLYRGWRRCCIPRRRICAVRPTGVRSATTSLVRQLLSAPAKTLNRLRPTKAGERRLAASA